MFFRKRKLVLAVTLSSMLMATGCADDNMSRGLFALVGATGGYFLGKALTPEGKDPKLTGAVTAGALGIAGAMFGPQLWSSITGGKKVAAN